MANTIIEPGLRADIMRKQMETKNQLKNKGDIYVGTGVSDESTGEVIYATDFLSVGSNNTILQADSNATNGLKYDFISENNFGNNKLPASIITESTTKKFVTQDQIDSWTAKQDAITDSNKLPVNKISGLGTQVTYNLDEDGTLKITTK